MGKLLQCAPALALACQISAWLTAANTGLPPDRQFSQHHIKAVLDTVNEESNFRPCVISRHGDEGLFQVRDGRRKALHADTKTPWKDCVTAEAQVRFMIAEITTNPLLKGKRFFAAKNYRIAKAAFVHGYEGR